MNCTSCGQHIHPRRYDMGYRTCINCSTEERWSGVPIINHKTGNEIQIVKDPEVAAEFIAKSARIGFGTLRGMTSSYKKPTNSNIVKTKELPGRPVNDRVLERKELPHEFDAVGSEMMDAVEREGAEAAMRLLDTALEQRRIYRKHHERLVTILQAFLESHRL